MSSNKTIAKNTGMLYIRMLISMLVGLYTSRVVLQTLGVEDYGIYGVVGGIVSIMGFLNASMAGATSRFITFELGKGNLQRVRDTFSSALIIHIIIAVIIIVVGETAGLWFLFNKLVIPEERMIAAHWVYQFSIISAAISVTQAPYSAVIMSHEKMDIYAYFELLNVALKLAIVYILLIGDFDKLILYALLTLIVSLFMCFLYRIYCFRHYDESHFRWVWDKEILNPLMSFSGWDLYGNMSSSVTLQGRNFIANMFFGVVINAACGIASTVQGVLQSFSGTLVNAIRPQIIKSYALEDYTKMQSLVINGTKFSIVLLMMLSIPIVFNMDYILSSWLGDVPDYTNTFCVISISQNIFSIISTYFIIGIHATGEIKKFFYTGTLALLQLPFLYTLFHFSDDPNWIYYTSFCYGILFILICGYILKVQIPQLSVWDMYKNSMFTIFLCVLCSTPLIPIVIHTNGFWTLFFCFLTYILLLALATYLFLLDKHTRKVILSKIRRI